MFQQTELPLLPAPVGGRPIEDPDRNRIERTLGFLSAGVAAILDNLPLPLHVRVTLERRAGWCPCCQQAKVCDGNGKLPGAEFDHWYGRNRNSADETWLVCSSCNRELEVPAFKATMRTNFYAYQAAVLIFMADAQRDLFD
ncbi:MAG: hypothetical protein ABSF22_06235 [Bryobacteraceae bacterium]